MKRNFLIYFIIAGFIFVCCTEQPTKTEDQPPLAPTMIAMEGPGSANAPAAIGQKADEVNAWFVYISNLLLGIEASKPSVNSNIYQWELAYGNGSVMRQIKVVRRSDKSIDWTVVLDGTADDGTVYVKRTVVIGKAGDNNNSQSWTLYDLSSGDESMRIVWQKDNSGTIDLSYHISAIAAEWAIVNRADDSGSYRYIFEGNQQFIANWLANGSGTFFDYTGGIVHSGSWN